jgi:hypothetical protein
MSRQKVWTVGICCIGLCASSVACSANGDVSIARRPSPQVAGSGGPLPSASGDGPIRIAGGIPTGEVAGAAAISGEAGRPQSPEMRGVCEVVLLVADPQTPDMMIVLDRSGSMQEAGRWQPSVSAVRRVTTELETKIHFGLALFPDPAVRDASGVFTDLEKCFSAPDPQMCLDEITATLSNSVCAPGAVVVPVGPANAAPIAKVLDTTQPTGGTPTAETLERLLQSYPNLPAGPDTKAQNAKFVLLVTDGQPTCPAGLGDETTPADIERTNAAIAALAARDVKTYVIGYDTSGASNAMLASVLDGFAQRGGTGDTRHRSVEDEASLLASLKGITSAVASCSFALDKAPPRADFVLVRMDGQQLNLGQPNGWQLVGDRTIELTGTACATFKNGNHVLEAEVKCEVVGPV